MRAEHTRKTIESEIWIGASPSVVWDNITNVKLEQFADPLIFRLLDVPKPMRAELLTNGAGGSRVAYFENGKRFAQEILLWEPYARYSFLFNPEPGFRVGYIFELSSGIFRMLSGAYYLREDNKGTWLKLQTEYSVQRNISYVLLGPITLVLRIFQQYLLTSIKKNAV
jgi:hypothetical protein